MKYNRFYINFSDQKQPWGFKVSADTDDETSLVIELAPHCICGCRLDIYKKITLNQNYTRYD